MYGLLQAGRPAHVNVNAAEANWNLEGSGCNLRDEKAQNLKSLTSFQTQRASKRERKTMALTPRKTSRPLPAPKLGPKLRNKNPHSRNLKTQKPDPLHPRRGGSRPGMGSPISVVLREPGSPESKNCTNNPCKDPGRFKL